MGLPMVTRMLKQLFRKPATNPFPARYLPPSVITYLEAVSAGKAAIHPPVGVPEGFRGKITYNNESCTGCGLCARVCPAHALEVNRDEKCLTVYVGQCIACGQCTEACSRSSLHMSDDFLIADTNRYADALVLR